jgi:ATP-dependent helicase/nuclease subunit B
MGFTKTTTKKSAGKEFHRKITESLFQPASEADKFPMQSHITLFAAKDRREETEIIAKTIRHLIREQPKRPLDRICVATFRPDLYTKHFREVFEQYGIPVNITDRYYLDQSPIVVAILSLLMIHQRDFMVSDIMRALSSVYIRLTYNGEPINSGAVYESAVKLKITGGYSAWMRKIEDRLQLLPTLMRDADHERDKRDLQHEEEILKGTKITLHVIRDLLKNFDETMTPRGFKERLLRLIDNVNLTDNILRGTSPVRDDDQLEKDTRALEKFLDFIDELLEILALEGKGAVVEKLPFYLNRLRESMTPVRYNIRQKYGYGVAVTSMDETRGLDFDVMILAGMVDGEFPPVYRPEIFFSSAQRLRREKYHLQEHRYLFYQMLCSFNDRLFITFPQTDDENELIQSSFVDALMDVVDVEDCREKYPLFLTEILYTKLDAIRHIGVVVGNGGTVENELEKIGNNKEITQHTQAFRKRMDVEKARIEGGAYPEFRGIIGDNPESSIEKILSDLRNRIYSVTRLEKYGSCPFHYFSDELLRLNVIDEIEEDLTALERGSLIHEVLFEFYLNRRVRKLKTLRDVNDKEFEEAYKDLCEITRKKLSLFSISSPFWELDEEQIFGSGKRKGVLLEFLEYERTREYTVSPAYFEVEFGSKKKAGKGTDPSLHSDDPVSAGKVRLKGKVDRIDTGDSIFRIIDYKTGTAVPNRKLIDDGVSLQLPVYLYAVEEMLKKVKCKEWLGIAGVYYILKNKVWEELGIGDGSQNQKVFKAAGRSNQLCADRSELRQVIQQTLDYVNEYVEKIAAGQFPVEPKVTKTVCERCEHKTICRVRLKSILSSEETEGEINGED